MKLLAKSPDGTLELWMEETPYGTWSPCRGVMGTVRGWKMYVVNKSKEWYISPAIWIKDERGANQQPPIFLCKNFPSYWRWTGGCSMNPDLADRCTLRTAYDPPDKYVVPPHHKRDLYYFDNCYWNQNLSHKEPSVWQWFIAVKKKYEPSVWQWFIAVKKKYSPSNAPSIGNEPPTYPIEESPQEPPSSPSKEKSLLAIAGLIGLLLLVGGLMQTR